jgi:hypothetical protein
MLLIDIQNIPAKLQGNLKRPSRYDLDFVGKQTPRMPLNVVAQYLAGALLNLLKW